MDEDEVIVLPQYYGTIGWGPRPQLVDVDLIQDQEE